MIKNAFFKIFTLSFVLKISVMSRNDLIRKIKIISKFDITT